jgi:hypothetical protein
VNTYFGSFLDPEWDFIEKKYQIQKGFCEKKVWDYPPVVHRDNESDLSHFYKSVFSSHTNMALVVPYENLGLLKVCFPQLKIRRYEDWDHFFIYNHMAGHGEFRSRVKYDGLINLVDELWRPDQPVKFGDGIVYEVDCIVCTKEVTVERTVLSQLCKRMWVDCNEDSDGWESAGEL